MIVIADTGPLIAFAKINGFDALFSFSPHVLIAPKVYEESITEGIRLGAEDAQLIADEFKRGTLEVRAPTISSLVTPALIDEGEAESIRLALELKPEWLIVDDMAARRAAEHNFAAANIVVGVKGTLGVIVSAFLEKHITRERAIALVESIEVVPIFGSAPRCAIK